MRTCVACRTVRPKPELVRVVRATDGAARLDPGGHAHGRGAYLCADRPCAPDARTAQGVRRALGAALPPAEAATLVGHRGGDTE